MSDQRPPWWRPLARRRWRQQRRVAVAATLACALAENVAHRLGYADLTVAGQLSAGAMLDGGKHRDGFFYPRLDVEVDLADLDNLERDIQVAAAALIAAIAAEHGPGLVWTRPFLDVVHLVYDQGQLVRPTGVRLRASYCHANHRRPVTPPPPPEDA